MNRRDSIKTIVISSLASGLILEGCIPGEKEVIYENVWKYKYGRTPEELQRDLELLNQVFFSKRTKHISPLVSRAQELAFSQIPYDGPLQGVQPLNAGE